MSVFCPFCLSESTALPRCPSCHGALPNTQTPGEISLPGWQTRAQLRHDASGTWLLCGKDTLKGLAWVSDPGRENAGRENAGRENSGSGNAAVPEKAWSLSPLEQGRHEGRSYCIWPWPEVTLPAEAPLDPKAGFALWSSLQEVGAFAHYKEVFPWEIARFDGRWSILSGRGAVHGLPAPGTIFAPERLLGTAPTEKSAVFVAAAWFLFIVSGSYPIGLPTPISWRKTNLEKLDVVVFEALRAESARRPSLEDFTSRLAENVCGRSVVQWMTSGLLYAAGAAFLVAWAGGVLWAISVFDLL